MNLLASLLESGYHVLVLWMMLALHPAPAVTPGLGEGFWHTRGSQLLDSGNRPVRIAGINWYGFETIKQVPGGLDVQDYRAILDTIRDNGFNTVRIPLSNEMVEHPIIPAIIRFANASGPINTDLKGLNSLQILDRIVAYARDHGLKIILDNHRSEAGDSASTTGLWFTQAYPESAWIADWQMLTRRYADNPAVIGMDIRNEPHNANAGGACWGCGGANDWRFAAERGGNAILSINPKLLIFVEGIDVYEDDYYWWGGNLEGVRSFPVRLAVPNQLVYSAHDYGPAESGQAWFTPTTSAASLAAVWDKHWAYIAKDGIAPVWLGEFGVDTPDPANQSPAQALQQQWFTSIIQFLSQNPRIGWTYWSLNHSDRYGILNANYDSTPTDSDRQHALASIQFPLGIGQHSSRGVVYAATITPTVNATQSTDSPQAPAPNRPVNPADSTIVVPVPPPATAPVSCHVEYTDLNDWKSGFTGGIVLHNTGTQAINGWKLTWSYSGDQHILELWDGVITQNGPAVTISNAAWNATIEPHGSPVHIGFNAAYTDKNQSPVHFYLNGTLCK